MDEKDPSHSKIEIRTAYRIITTLVDTLTASSDLIAKMAQLLGEDAARALQQDPTWQAYLEAKRRLEHVHEDMHAFAQAATAHIELENALAGEETASGEAGSPADEHQGDVP